MRSGSALTPLRNAKRAVLPAAVAPPRGRCRSAPPARRRARRWYRCRRARSPPSPGRGRRRWWWRGPAPGRPAARPRSAARRRPSRAASAGRPSDRACLRGRSPPRACRSARAGRRPSLGEAPEALDHAGRRDREHLAARRRGGAALAARPRGRSLDLFDGDGDLRLAAAGAHSPPGAAAAGDGGA